MPDWTIITIFCGGIGYWIATKYRLDGKAGFALGSALSLLFNGGLYNEFSKYDSSMKLLLVEFVALLCLTFLLLLERGTVVAWLKLAAFTLIVTAFSHGAFSSRFDYREAKSAISAAAKDPSGTFELFTKEVKTKLARMSPPEDEDKID